MALDVKNSVRDMRFEDLDMVLAWRNAPEVRSFMYTQLEITLEEHTRWFRNAGTDKNRHLLIFEWSGEPLGFVSLNQISGGGVADWGFYVAPAAPKGTGRALGRSALLYAFETVNLYKVCGQALAYNERSIRFHREQGFQQEGLLRSQHFDGQQYHSVVCFGLLASEWQTQNQEINS